MDGWLTTDPTSSAQTFNQRQRLFFAVALSNSAHVLVSDAPVCSALPSFMSSLRSHTVRCPRLMAHDLLRPSTPRAPGTKGFPIVVDNIARTTFHAPRFLHDIYFHAARMRGRRGRPGGRGTAARGTPGARAATLGRPRLLLPRLLKWPAPPTPVGLVQPPPAAPVLAKARARPHLSNARGRLSACEEGRIGLTCALLTGCRLQWLSPEMLPDRLALALWQTCGTWPGRKHGEPYHYHGNTIQS